MLNNTLETVLVNIVHYHLHMIVREKHVISLTGKTMLTNIYVITKRHCKICLHEYKIILLMVMVLFPIYMTLNIGI